MPLRKEENESDGNKSTLRLSGLFLRRIPDREFHTYIPLLDYNPSDYQVLLRFWGSEPFPRHLGAFSGPMIAGKDPEEMLLNKSSQWTNDLASRAEINNYKPIRSHKAVFLSLHGGGHYTDSTSEHEAAIGMVLCYVVPIKQRDSTLISLYPDLPQYPKFYNLGSILHQMARSEIKIHPYTREMLASLDHWLREQHEVPGGINSLFAPSLQSRMKMFVVNSLFVHMQENAQTPMETPNHSFVGGMAPLVSSTPFNGPGEDNTLHETTGFTVSKVKELDSTVREYLPVDMIVENPIFGSGLRLKNVDILVTNDYFGYGEPDYSALKSNKGKWVVEVPSDGLPDWTEMFPLHKFCCEGNVAGVRKCIQMGLSADQRDSDSWSPLHYACWYGELECVKALVEASATIGIQNSEGSTPLHLAAGTGHAAVVSYLLKQRAGQGVKAALNNDGKSPLAVCIDCKMNDWTKTIQILKDAYSNPTPAELSFPPPLFPYSPLHPSSEELDGDKDLGLKGSLGNLNNPKAKAKSPEPKPAKTIRRQRVNLGIGQHQMAHFFNGRETTCNDVILNLYRLVKLPKNFHSLFALWIASNSLELQLGDTDQPLKLIYSWKKLLSKYGTTATGVKGEAERPALHLWRNVFLPTSAEKNITDAMALEFLYADAQRHIVNCDYPCAEDDAFYLAGITLQITYGDYNEVVHGPGFIRDKLNSVLPSHMTSSKRKVEYERKVLAKYAEISQFGFDDTKFLYQAYLKHCWQWPYYGATFYEGMLHTKETKLEIKGRLSRKSQLPINIGINTSGFHLVNSETKTLLVSIPFDGLDWDFATAKQEMVIYNENRTTYLLIHSRKSSLLYSLATRMREQYSRTG